MTNNFKDLYLNFIDLYQSGKEAALVRKQLQIEEGMNINLAEKQYQDSIQRMDLQIQTINSFVFYVIQNMGAHTTTEPDTFFKNNILKFQHIKISTNSPK